MNNALKREIEKCCQKINSQLNDENRRALKNTQESDLLLSKVNDAGKIGQNYL